MFFDNLPKYESLSLACALNVEAVRNTFTAIAFFTDMHEQSSALLDADDEKLAGMGADVSAVHEAKADLENLRDITGRILGGAPYLLISSVNAENAAAAEEYVEESLEDDGYEIPEFPGRDEHDLFFGTAVFLSESSLAVDTACFYGYVYLLDKAGASYAVARTGDEAFIIVEFSEFECRGAGMRTEKTGGEEGTLLVPKEGDFLPVINVITKSDLAWYRENS